MSQLLKQANEKDVGANEQRMAVIKSRSNNFLQWSKGQTASTKNINPGTSTTIDIKFNSSNWEEEKAHYVKFNIVNAHATDTLLLLNGPLNIFNEIAITINDGEHKIEVVSLAQIHEMYSEWLLNQGLNIYEEKSFVTDEFNTYAGISVAPLS